MNINEIVKETGYTTVKSHLRRIHPKTLLSKSITELNEMKQKTASEIRELEYVVEVGGGNKYEEMLEHSKKKLDEIDLILSAKEKKEEDLRSSRGFEDVVVAGIIIWLFIAFLVKIF